MWSRKAGVVVFISSSVAWEGFPALGAYCASKAAIHCMSLSSFLLYAHRHIDGWYPIQTLQNLFLKSLSQLESRPSSLNRGRFAPSFSATPQTIVPSPSLKTIEPFRRQWFKTSMPSTEINPAILWRESNALSTLWKERTARMVNHGRFRCRWGQMQSPLSARNAKTRFETWKPGRTLPSQQTSRHRLYLSGMAKCYGFTCDTFWRLARV